LYIVFHGASANAYASNNLVTVLKGNPAAENNNAPNISIVNAEQGLARLRNAGQIAGWYFHRY